MMYDSFCDQCKKAMPGQDKFVERFVRNANEIFSYGRGYNERQNVYALFTRGKSVGKTTFYKTKRCAKLFYEWLYQQLLVDLDTVQFVNALNMGEVLARAGICESYFRNLDELLSFIENFGGAQSGGKESVLFIESISILAWYGVSVIDMCQIRFDHLDSEREVLTFPQEIQLPSRCFDILYRLSKQSYRPGLLTGRRYKMAVSPFLFRTASRSKLDEQSVARIVADFNRYSKAYGKVVRVRDLKRNSEFCRVREAREEKVSLVKTVISIVGCDAAMACGFCATYNAWEEEMFGIGKR